MNEEPNPLPPLDENGNAIVHAGKQPVLSSLSSEVHAAPGSNDSHSTKTGQGHSDNPPMEEVHP